MKFFRSSDSERLQMNDYMEGSFDITCCKFRTATNFRKRPKNLSNCYDFFFEQHKRNFDLS